MGRVRLGSCRPLICRWCMRLEWQSGWEATRAIRAREALARDVRAGLLIIGLPAAAATPRDAARCRECGMTTFMAGSGVGGGAAVAQCIRDGMLLRSREALEVQRPAFSLALAAHPSPEPGGARDSEAGKGLMPQAKGAATAEGGPGPTSADSPPPQVLIVSADPGRRAVLAALLRSCAAAAGPAVPPKALIASNGDSARSALARCPVDLVFVDAELLLDGGWLSDDSCTPGAAGEAGRAACGIAGRTFVVAMSPTKIGNSIIQGDACERHSCGDGDGGPGGRYGAVVERPVTRDAVRSVLSEYMGLRRAASATARLPGYSDEVLPPLPAVAMAAAAPQSQAQVDAGSAAQACSLLAPGVKPYSAKILIVEGTIPTCHVPPNTSMPLTAHANSGTRPYARTRTERVSERE
jgi:hypothetical protein